MFGMLKNLFGSRKWVAALGTIVIDLLVFWQLPVPLATAIATFVTITTTAAILGQAYIDANGG